MPALNQIIIKILKVFILAICCYAFISVSCLANDSINDPRDSSIYDKYLDNSNGVTSIMIECITEETERLDKLLNKCYKKI